MVRLMMGVAALAAATPASAHIVFAEPQAQAGGYYAGFLRVGHGCGTAATTGVRVEIPEGIETARPQPKPGWTLRVERVPLAEPRAAEGGGTIAERVSAITWQGKLPADQFDQFGMLLKLPGAAGPLYFPTVQTSETGGNEWTQVPAQPEGWHALPRPAPMLMLVAGGHAGH